MTLNKAWQPFITRALSRLKLHATPIERGEAALKGKNIIREASFALPQETESTLKNLLLDLIERNPGKSGFRVFEKGGHSLYARLGLIKAAEKAIDLQYYAIANDITSNLMMEAISRAARRGVKVRILIDGFTLAKIAKELSSFDHLNNIQVRVFNPVGFANENKLIKYVSNILHREHLIRRMHNKALIVDGQMAMIGGRNLGDEYFEAHTDVSFKDIDILTAGSITKDISQSFDDFWNHELSYPLAAITRIDPSQAEAVRTALTRNWDDKMTRLQNKFDYNLPAEKLFAEELIKLTWAQAQFLADKPQKITHQGKVESPPFLALMTAADQAQKEILFISSYFVPKAEGVKWFKGLNERHIDIKILTNSLASTDVVAVHSGYQKYRKALLQHGIKLYEFKPVTKKKRQRILGKSAPARAGLHAKFYLIDQRYALIGSLNLDPRSKNLNTEILLMIDSAEITKSLRDGFQNSISLDSSYHLSLKNGSLVWKTEEDNQMRTFTSEPNAGFFRQLQNKLFSLLPIEDNL